MITLKFIDPLEDPDGCAMLECSFSESYRDEQIITLIAETLNRQNLVRAISELELQLSRKEKEGRIKGMEELRRFKQCLQAHPDLEIQRLPTINRENSRREFIRTFRFQFVRKPMPGTSPLPASTPSWALSGRQDPEGSSEY